MGESLELVGFRPEFLEPVLRWRRQESMVRFNPLAPLEREALADRLQTDGNDWTRWNQHNAFRWFALSGENLVGTVSLSNINRMMQFVELGYSVDDQYQGRGYGTQMVGQALFQLFEKTKTRRVIAYVHCENQPSCRLLEKLGFQKEGVLRDHFLIDGEPVTEFLYGLLKPEFCPPKERADAKAEG